METGTYKASFINGTNYSEVLFTVEFHVTKLPASAEKPDGDVIIKYGDTEIGLFTIDSAGSYTDPIIPYVDIFGEGALSKQWRSTEYPKTYLADLQKSASYFAFAINNTSGSNLMLNWQPFVYLETAEINHCAFFTSESLAENNVWLVNKQWTRTAPEFSAAADNQNGRDLIIIPDGFDGYLILATSVLKGEQDILWDATAGLLRFNECFLAKENADGTPANTPDALSYISDFYALKTLPTYTGDKTDHTQTGDAAPQAAMMAVLVVLAFEALYILFRRKKTS